MLRTPYGWLVFPGLRRRRGPRSRTRSGRVGVVGRCDLGESPARTAEPEEKGYPIPRRFSTRTTLPTRENVAGSRQRPGRSARRRRRGPRRRRGRRRARAVVARAREPVAGDGRHGPGGRVGHEVGEPVGTRPLRRVGGDRRLRPAVGSLPRPPGRSVPARRTTPQPHRARSVARRRFSCAAAEPRRSRSAKPRRAAPLRVCAWPSGGAVPRPCTCRARRARCRCSRRRRSGTSPGRCR